MPANRNALIRYKTIDMCLQNRYRKWTLEDLIEACSDALYEYEGIGKGVSRRTVQLDLQLMRSDKLGYNAPIIVIDKKYYTYEDSDYSIMNIPVSESDLNQLLETVEFLKQFKGFSHFKELDTIVQKLEDHVYASKTKRKPIIDFEKNDSLKGIEYLDNLYQAIAGKHVIEITYKSFNARKANTFVFYPYMLKEFRNRWFLIGSRNNDDIILNLAIDRIQDIKITEKKFIDNSFDSERYFKDVIGVTVSPGSKPEKVVLFVSRKHAPYVLTKPFHHSQKLIEQNEYGIIIEFEVQHNYELEKEILGLGDGITVVAPERLKNNIKGRLNNAIDQYKTLISEDQLDAFNSKFKNKGFCTINQLYSRKNIVQMGLSFSKTEDLGLSEKIDIDPIKYAVPSIEKVITQLSETARVKYCSYYTRIPEEYFEFYQLDDGQIEVLVLVAERKSTPFYVEVIPGSQNKKFNRKEKDLITASALPVECRVSAGGAIIVDSMLLRRFPEVFRGVKVSLMIITYENKETEAILTKKSKKASNIESVIEYPETILEIIDEVLPEIENNDKPKKKGKPSPEPPKDQQLSLF